MENLLELHGLADTMRAGLTGVTSGTQPAEGAADELLELSSLKTTIRSGVAALRGKGQRRLHIFARRSPALLQYVRACRDARLKQHAITTAGGSDSGG